MTMYAEKEETTISYNTYYFLQTDFRLILHFPKDSHTRGRTG